MKEIRKKKKKKRTIPERPLFAKCLANPGEGEACENTGTRQCCDGLKMTH